MKMLIDKVDNSFEKGEIVFFYSPSTTPEYNIVKVGRVSFSYDTPDGKNYVIESIGGREEALTHFRADQLSRTFEEAKAKHEVEAEIKNGIYDFIVKNGKITSLEVK